MINFKNKTVLVTGGGAGIGRGIAESFGAAGARVVVAEIDKARADAVRAALSGLGVENLVIEADVTKKSAVDAVMRQISDQFGGLDVLVNNVGDYLGIVKPLADTTEEECDRLYATNMKHLFLVSRAAIPLLRKNAPGSSIISISSIEGFRGIPMNTVYSAFKTGVTGFTKSLALELAADGIRVNLIAPETTHTAQVPVLDMVAPEHKDNIRRWIPLGRFGEPADAAGAALFLASPLASWVTGTAINLDGGALAAGGWYRDANNIWTNVPVIPGNGFNFGKK